MKTIKTTLFFVLTFIIYTFSFAQPVDLLENLPESREEFVASEKNVIATINWLEDTSLDIETEKRNVQKALLLGWLINSPTVSVEVNSEVLTFTEKNSYLLVTFMGGWIKYCLDNNYSSDKVKGNMAGIKSVIKVYQKGIGLKKDKEMEKIIKIDIKGELENWVRKKIIQK